MTVQRVIVGMLLVGVLLGATFFFKERNNRLAREQQETTVKNVYTNVYQNSKYGFKVTHLSLFKALPLYGTDCTFSNGEMIYNPIAEIPITFKKTDCAHDTQDSLGYYLSADLLVVARVYDLARCIYPKPDKLYPGGGKEVGDTYFCNDVKKLPLNVAQKMTGFGMEGSKLTALILKTEKYVIEFEGSDLGGQSLGGIQIEVLQ